MSDGDPEDWPTHPVELRQLERSLRCQICQDVYQGPVSLTCGHTFCSMCIRSTLSVFSKEGRQQACPTCREAADVTHLRPIQHLRDAAAAWKGIRQLLLSQHLQAVEQQQQQVSEPLVVHQQQRQAGQQQDKHLGNGKAVQQRQLARQPSKTPPVSRQISGHSRQLSGSSRGRQKTPEPAITISSTGVGGSLRGAADASDTSEDEVASVQQDSDPDWSAEDCDHQQQRQGPTAVQPASKRRLRNSSTSTGIDASPLAAVADDADSDRSRSDVESDFERAEMPAPKRARAAVQQPGPGKENRIGPAVPQQHEQPAQAGSSAEHQQQQAQQPGYVACPICSSSVKETFINSHIDSCLARMSSGEQRQQRSAGRTSTTAGKRPAAAAAVGTKPRVAPPQTVTADSVVTGNNIPGGSDGGKLGSCRITTAAGGVGASSSGVGVRRVRLKALEPPPKLCFDLLKDKDLKGKLTQLGLSSEGGKKVCAQRYTSFRNYVLSLQDSGATMTQKEAAAEFTRDERKHARAVSRPQSVAALASAGGPASAAAGATAAGQRSGSRGPDDRSIGPAVVMLDNSYATLIYQTKERMAKRKEQAEQKEQQQLPEQHQQEELLNENATVSAAQTSFQQHDMPQQQAGEPSRLNQLQQKEAYTADTNRSTGDLQQDDRGVAVVVTAAADTGALKQQQLTVAAALDACTAVPCLALESDCYQGLMVPDSDDGF